MSCQDTTAVRLAAVSGWDVPALRGAVTTLDSVTGRLAA